MNNTYKIFVLFVWISLLTMSCQQGNPASKDKADKSTARIITMSGFLTELIYELGHAEDLVGRDGTSTYPKALVDSLPNLGHATKLNVEAVLQLKPSLIFVEDDQEKKIEVLQQIKDAGIEVVIVPTSTHLNNAVKAAKVVQPYLKIEDTKISEMAKTIERDSMALATHLATIDKKPNVLFIYARGAGRLMVAGKNTSASSIIKIAGGKNAISSFEDFKPLTPEALIEAAPDVILMFKSGLASLDGKKGLEQITGIPQTPAFQNDRIVTMDGHYLLSFGPRVGKAVTELANQIHTTGKSPTL
ncbi:MAG: ABC transporter substrate-binding protein [Bacteroidota bacterium]